MEVSEGGRGRKRGSLGGSDDGSRGGVVQRIPTGGGAYRRGPLCGEGECVVCCRDISEELAEGARISGKGGFWWPVISTLGA